MPRSGLIAVRIACGHGTQPWLPAFVKSVYRANFEFDQDTSSEETVERCLQSLHLEAGQLLAEAKSEEAKARLRDQTQRAMELGIFGAPSFLVGEELFWGNDRLEQALAWAVGHQT